LPYITIAPVGALRNPALGSIAASACSTQVPTEEGEDTRLILGRRGPVVLDNDDACPFHVTLPTAHGALRVRAQRRRLTTPPIDTAAGAMLCMNVPATARSAVDILDYWWPYGNRDSESQSSHMQAARSSINVHRIAADRDDAGALPKPRAETLQLCRAIGSTHQPNFPEQWAARNTLPALLTHAERRRRDGLLEGVYLSVRECGRSEVQTRPWFPRVARTEEQSKERRRSSTS
jgi:hypothetical protein